MEGVRTRQLPPRTQVAREQLRFVVASAGRSWPILALLALLFAWAAASARGGFPAHGVAIFLTVMTASIVTGAAWTRQPGRRDSAAYFLSLPGARPANIAIRTASAWTVVILAGIVLSSAAHGVGTPNDQPAWSYLAPFVGATVVLLAMSGPMATVKHYGVWISGIVWVPLILSKLGGTVMGDRLLLLLEGRWGVVSLMSGQILVSGHLLGPEADTTPARFLFDLPSWLIAGAIWLMASLLLFAVMSFRKVEA